MGHCPTHGTLIGGYALGALEPEEMEEMRRHVAVCPQCGPEAHRLEELPGLLDRIAPADVPPPTLPPQVEEAVLDRFARERREEGGASGRRAGRAAERGTGRRTRRPALLGRRPLAVAAACLIALVVALAVVLPGGDEDGTAAYASVSLDPRAGASGSATAWLDEVPAGTRIRLETRALPANSQYEVWCIRTDGRWVSGGTFWTDRDGRVEAELTAAVRAGDYHRMVVTHRPEGAGEAERGRPVLGGELRY